MSVCLYSCLSYPAGKSHSFCAVLYCQVWHVWFYNIFPCYLTNSIIFKTNKQKLNMKCVFWFYLQVLC